MSDDLVDVTGLDASIDQMSAELDRVRAQRADLLAVLKRARDVIRAFHSIGITSVKEEDQLWARYQYSPEMQAINAAIKKAEKQEVQR